MRYIYRKKKPKFRYHIATSNGTVCRMENSTAFRKLDTLSDAPPPGRVLCQICAEQSGIPSLPPPACAAIFPLPAATTTKSEKVARVADPLLASFGIDSCPHDLDHTQITVRLALERLKERYGIEYRGKALHYGDARHILKRYLSGGNPKLHVLKHARMVAAPPKACKAKVVKSKGDRSAAKHPALTPERVAFIVSDAFLASYEWRKVRYEALKRGDGLCEVCGRGKVHGEVLNVDHIKCRRKHPELALVVSNLQITCGPCNHGKGNWDDTNWREKNAARLLAHDAVGPDIPWERFAAF